MPRVSEREKKREFWLERRDSCSRGAGGLLDDILRERGRDSMRRGDFGEVVERVRGASMVV